MNWLYSVLIGLFLGLIMRSKGESIALNIIAGIAGAIIGGVFFEYIIKALFSSYVDMLKWGKYAFLIVSLFGAFVIILIKRVVAFGSRD